jgi:hypothetical protein
MGGIAILLRRVLRRLKRPERSARQLTEHELFERLRDRP